MQLQEMRYAVAVMEHRSFTKAADALFVSQPALSQSIGRLEHELNTILFIRDRNHLYPTQAGILFVEEAKRILQMADDLRETMRGLCRTTTLSVGISNYYGQHYLPKIVPRFHEQCPEINVTFTEEIINDLSGHLFNPVKYVRRSVYGFCTRINLLYDK